MSRASDELRFDFEFENNEAESSLPIEAGPKVETVKDDSREIGRSDHQDLLSRVDRVRDVASQKTVRKRRTPRSSKTAIGTVESLGDESVDDAIGTSLSIAEFYERLKRALAAEFEDEIWVTGEIRGLRESRGHHYLELADHSTDASSRSAPQLEVVCWSRGWPQVARALSEAGVDLEVGRVVRVRGRVSVWEGGSKIRFTLTALDVEALLGGIAVARRQLLAALEKEGLLEANRRLALPLVPLKIGVVTSVGSEAHRDFVGQLERSGFSFEILLEPSLVQGPEAPAQLAGGLERLAQRAPDMAVIIRGGGARGDLAAFDSEILARAIAMSPFPIWSGIGHTGDRSVADEVVSRSLITPTACGEAVVGIVSSFWSGIERRVHTLSSQARTHLDTSSALIGTSRRTLGQLVRHQLNGRSSDLERARRILSRAVRSCVELEASRSIERRKQARIMVQRLVSNSEERVRHQGLVLRAYDPMRLLERGWSLTFNEAGALVRSVTDLSPGARITTRHRDGRSTSRVELIDAAKVDVQRDGVR